MTKVHDLSEYQLARDLCRELPKLKEIIIECQKKIEPYRYFTEGAKIYNDMHESLMVIDIYLHKYRKILNSKGQR